MGLLTGLLSSTLCTITAGVVGTAAAVPTGGVGIIYAVTAGNLCGAVITAATACPLLP